jgi:hypothetical protein
MDFTLLKDIKNMIITKKIKYNCSFYKIGQLAIETLKQVQIRLFFIFTNVELGRRTSLKYHKLSALNIGYFINILPNINIIICSIGYAFARYK